MSQAAGQQVPLFGEDAARPPLAARMRPRTLDEFVGQEHLLGQGRVLRRAIEQDRVGSIILWGPPGTGKTTLARLIAAQSGAAFEPLSAVAAGVADLRRVAADAARRRAQGRRTILFIDEVHRFNKSQQDAVLPHVESGLYTLIGATTENPSFEVNSALLSRCRVFTLRPLGPEHLAAIIDRALRDGERGLGALNVALADDARAFLITQANGDARVALNALELAATTAPADEQGGRRVTLELIADALQQRALLYDRAGDQHYDTISALHKSLRGSDPDAALYWLGRMLEAGEDPLYVARRLVRFASEDVGMADPMALMVAVAAQQAVHFVGLPEGALALAQACVYLAVAPKSNALYLAYWRVQEDLRNAPVDPVPLHIRNAPTALMAQLGYGRGYHYDHDRIREQPPADPEFPPVEPDQPYLPERLAGRRYYQPTQQGREARIASWLARRRAAAPLPGSAPEGVLPDRP